ncbi:hypothetical protein Gotri_022806 [Gossypium trilobum]|uniref:RNase H type-1 domain-containing protein n=1 Tax=Gossypium trilobum TaxID=34281 RepID=A0A7J9DH29_9ROSI|nr:hypothetical protein [Gossypium trilobum]
MEGKKVTRKLTRITWNPSLVATMKINFDATFNGNNARSASGVVVRNAPGEVVASKEINHSMRRGEEAYCEGDVPGFIKKTLDRRRPRALD